MFIKRIVLILISLLFAVSAAGCGGYSDSPKAFKYYRFADKRVFGNAITFSAAVRGGNEQAALNEMLELMEDINSDMSLSLSSSALSRFNALGAGESAAGYESERVEISADTYEVILKATEYYADTDGLFNIAAYPLVKLWHVDTDGLNEYGFPSPTAPPELPEYDAVLNTLGSCDLSNLKTLSENGKFYIYKTHPYLQIDLGAIAKGFAADKCIEIAERNGVSSALIDISGNICVMGEWYHPDEKKYVPWVLGITSPRPRNGFGGSMCALSAGRDKTLVTSGDYERYVLYGSDENTLYVPHIVSTVSGMPLGVTYSGEKYANTDNHIISATIICGDSCKADAYATAVCLMNADNAVKFLSERGLHAVLVTADNRMCLVGVTESDNSGDEFFTAKNEFGGYKSYKIEEYAVE